MDPLSTQSLPSLVHNIEDVRGKLRGEHKATLLTDFLVRALCFAELGSLVQSSGTMSDSFTKPEIPATGIMAGLQDEDRQLLGDYGEFLPVHPDQVVIQEGRDQDSLYFVISGVLHVHTDTAEKRTLVARIEAGETLGEVNLFDPATASASVTAREFSQVWKANRGDLEAFMTAYPAAAARLLAGILSEMSTRLRRMNEKLATREAEAAFQSFWS